MRAGRPTARALYIAAAVLAVMVSIGFASRLAREPEAEASPVMLQAEIVAPSAEAAIPSSGTVVPSAPVATPSAPAVIPSTPAARPSAPAAKPSAAAVKPSDPAVKPPASSVTPATRPVAQPTRSELAGGTIAPATVQRAVSTTSFAAVHQHRFGNCRGLLVVSRDGVAFVPDEGKDKGDAFSFSYSEFLHSLEDESLTITSRDRTYRFKAALATDKDDNENKLQQLASSIALFR